MFVIVLIIAGLWMMVSSMWDDYKKEAQAYSIALSEYNSRRRALENRIELAGLKLHPELRSLATAVACKADLECCRTADRLHRQLYRKLTRYIDLQHEYNSMSKPINQATVIGFVARALVSIVIIAISIIPILIAVCI